jgi:fructan beta-fructosidase
VTFEPGKAKEVVLNIRGVPVVYSAADKQLMVDGVKAPVSLIDGKLNLIVYADRTGLEIFVNNGLVFMPVNINLPVDNRSLSLSAKGGTVKVSRLDVHELKSIWAE